MNTNKLKAKMTELGFTQRSLAECVKMSKTTLNAKINGKNNFNISEVVKVCDILEITSPQDKVDIFLT